jgi:hypothetical protein
MSLVKVWTDVGKKRPVPLIAKIIEKDGPILTIKYLTEGKDKIWKYEEDTYDIEDDSIAEYLKTDDEAHLGFRLLDDGGYIHIQDDISDEEYNPDEDEEDSCEEDSDDDLVEDDDDVEEEEFSEDIDSDDEDDEVEDDEDNYVE